MPGFWRRSIEEFKRQATIAVNMEGLHVPTKPFPLVRFENEESLGRCVVMCDQDIGGFSPASLTLERGTASPGSPRPNNSGGDTADPPHALFKGSISTELPPDRPDVHRSGYAAWRTRDRGFSLFGKLLWDISPYQYLALRIKSDGRKYFINIQTESVIPTDLHQHLLPCFAPGQWETVTVPFGAFVRTNHGMVVEPQREMLRPKVKSVGIGLTDRVQGPFELRIAEVYATNTVSEAEKVRRDSGFGELELPDEKRGLYRDAKTRREKKDPERILI